MHYKVAYGIVIEDSCGDIYHHIIGPVAYDERHLKTREQCLAFIRRKCTTMMDNIIDNREDATLPDEYEWRGSNFYSNDADMPFNRNNNINKIDFTYYNYEDYELYLSAYVYETKPIFVKEAISDLKEFDYVKERGKEFYDIRNEDRLRIKQDLYASFYQFCPDYDTDERYIYFGGVNALSKNLLSLLKEEKRTFRENSREFFFQVYDNCEQTENEEYWDKCSLQDRIKLPRDIKNIGSFHRGARILEMSDDNGFYTGCGIISIPLVSYNGR